MTKEHMWDEMIQQSFHPRQWFDEIDDDNSTTNGGMAMWVYRQVVDGFCVGFYDPKGEWIDDSLHHNRESAAERVNYLNGGNK